jgi:hypothetical protein
VLVDASLGGRPLRAVPRIRGRDDDERRFGRDGCPDAALDPLLELGDDLLVRRGEGGRRKSACRGGLA